MLQLPHQRRVPVRFSKADIAEMSRGGPVQVREKKVRSDHVARLVNIFKQRVKALEVATKAFDGVKALLEPEGADGDPMLFVYSSEARPLVVVSQYFGSVDHIDREAKARRKDLRKTIAYRRKALKRPEGIVSHYETRQSLEACLKDLKALPSVVARIKRDFRKLEKDVRSAQHRANYKKFQRAEDRARVAVADAYARIENAEILTHGDALAMLDLSCVIIDSRVYYPGSVPVHIERARSFLSARV